MTKAASPGPKCPIRGAGCGRDEAVRGLVPAHMAGTVLASGRPGEGLCLLAKPFGVVDLLEVVQVDDPSAPKDPAPHRIRAQLGGRASWTGAGAAWLALRACQVATASAPSPNTTAASQTRPLRTGIRAATAGWPSQGGADRRRKWKRRMTPCERRTVLGAYTRSMVGASSLNGLTGRGQARHPLVVRIRIPLSSR